MCSAEDGGAALGVSVEVGSGGRSAEGEAVEATADDAAERHAHMDGCKRQGPMSVWVCCRARSTAENDAGQINSVVWYAQTWADRDRETETESRCSIHGQAGAKLGK